MCVKPRRCGTGARRGVHAHAVGGQPLGRARAPRSSSPSAVKKSAPPPSLASWTAATAPPPAGVLPRLRRVCTMSPGAGSRGTRANSIHSTCPTTATRVMAAMTVADGAWWAVSGSSRVAAAFHDATAREPGAQLELAHGGVAELGGQRLRRGEADAHPVADRGDRDDLDGEVVAGRARVGGVLGRERDLPRVDADRDRARRRGRARITTPPPSSSTCVARAGHRVREAGQHDRAGEVGHERRRRLGGEPRRLAALDDPPAVDDRDLVAEQRRLGEVVRDEQRRARPRRAARRAELAPPPRRACGRRAPTAARRAAAPAGRARAPAPAPRAGARRPTACAAARRRSAADAEALEQLLRALAARAPRQPGQRVGDVLPRAQVPEQRVLLEHVAAAAPLGRDVDPARGVEPHLLAAAPRVPSLGPQQPGGDAQDRASCPRRRARPAPGSGPASTSSATSRSSAPSRARASTRSTAEPSGAAEQLHRQPAAPPRRRRAPPTAPARSVKSVPKRS